MRDLTKYICYNLSDPFVYKMNNICCLFRGICYSNHIIFFYCYIHYFYNILWLWDLCSRLPSQHTKPKNLMPPSTGSTCNNNLEPTSRHMSTSQWYKYVGIIKTAGYWGYWPLKISLCGADSAEKKVNGRN